MLGVPFAARNSMCRLSGTEDGNQRLKMPLHQLLRIAESSVTQLHAACYGGENSRKSFLCGLLQTGVGGVWY